MECNRWEEEGLLYTSGELSVEESTLYKTHLNDCALCKKEYDEYNELLSDFIQGEFPLAELSEEVDQRIKARIIEAAENRNPSKGHYILGMSFVTLMKRSTIALVVVALSYFATIQLGTKAPDTSGQFAGSEPAITIRDSSVNDSLKKFQQGDAQGIKSVNVREE